MPISWITIMLDTQQLKIIADFLLKEQFPAKRYQIPPLSLRSKSPETIISFIFIATNSLVRLVETEMMVRDVWRKLSLGAVKYHHHVKIKH